MDYIPIGTITTTQGLDGAVRVKSDSDFKESRYQAGSRLYIRKAARRIPVTVASHREKGTLDILRFEEFASIEEVEPFKGCTLEVHVSDRDPLEAGAYYYDQLAGLEVLLEGRRVGVVKDVFPVPQGTMLRVSRENARDALVPFLKEYVRHVDVQQGYLELEPLEGLI